MPENKWARLLGYVTGMVNQKPLLQKHCCPRQDGPVPWSAENTRLGGVRADYLSGGLRFEFSALSENLTKCAYYADLPILRTTMSSRLLTASRLALSSR